MNFQSENFFKKLSCSFSNAKYSDCIIHIVEKPSSRNRLLRKQSYENESLCKSFSEKVVDSIPAHKLVLASQSKYFEKLFLWDKEKEENKNQYKLILHCEDIPYASKFLQCFYQHNVINGMTLLDAWQILKLADLYSCDPIVENAHNFVQSFAVQSICDCENVLDGVQNLEFGPLMEKLADRILKICHNYICDLFFPLEQKYNSSKSKFNNLSFNLLLILLKHPTKSLCTHENSLLYFLIKWFEYDVSRQTSQNIQLVLAEISRRDLTPLFLVEVVTSSHSILSKTEFFNQWYIEALECFSLNFDTSRSLDLDKGRELKINEGIIVQKYRLNKNDDLDYFTEKPFILHGYEILPAIIHDQFGEDARDKLFIQIKVLNLPGNEAHAFLSQSFVVLCKRSDLEKNINDIDFKFEASSGNSFHYSEFSAPSFISYGSCYHLGYVDERCFRNWNTLDVCIAVKDSSEEWPDCYGISERFDLQYIEE